MIACSIPAQVRPQYCLLCSLYGPDVADCMADCMAIVWLIVITSSP